MTPAKTRRRKKQKAGIIVSVLLVTFCTALLGVGVWLFLQESGGRSDSIAGPFQVEVEGLDPAAKTGSLTAGRERVSGQNTFGYYINSSPVFDAAGKGDISIENPSFNKYLLVLEICSAGDPTLLYQSQYIAPNQYIDAIRLSPVPKAGTHDATAYLNLVDPETMKVADILECPLTMTVKAK